MFFQKKKVIPVNSNTFLHHQDHIKNNHKSFTLDFILTPIMILGGIVLFIYFIPETIFGIMKILYMFCNGKMF